MRRASRSRPATRSSPSSSSSSSSTIPRKSSRATGTATTEKCSPDPRARRPAELDRHPDRCGDRVPRARCARVRSRTLGRRGVVCALPRGPLGSENRGDAFAPGLALDCAPRGARDRAGPSSAFHVALALRLSREFPRAIFIEIDHPATQASKQRATERGGAPGNLRFIAADLSRVRLQDALSGGAYRPDGRSAFVIEGLLMYLTDAEVGGVFKALREP